MHRIFAISSRAAIRSLVVAALLAGASLRAAAQGTTPAADSLALAAHLATPALAPKDTLVLPVPGTPANAASAPGDGRLVTRRELVAGGVVLASSLALLPFDSRLAEHFRDPAPQRSHALRSAARTFNFLGDPGTVLVAVGAYGLGRVVRNDHLTDLGLHTSEAVVLGSTVTAVLKGFAGRQRPYMNHSDPGDFGFAQGFGSGGRTSFPSGHTTAAFAVASAITAETHHWWPGAPWIVGPVLYGGAGLVGLARMYDDKHWASDVVLGAGIGTLSGLSIVRWNHARPTNRVNRWLGVLSAPSVVPTGRGVALSWPIGG